MVMTRASMTSSELRIEVLRPDGPVEPSLVELSPNRVIVGCSPELGFLEEVTVRITDAGGTATELSGLVMWSSAHSCGIRFQDVDVRQLRTLHGWVYGHRRRTARPSGVIARADVPPDSGEATGSD